MTRLGIAGLIAGLLLIVSSCGEYAPADALVTAPIVKQGQCATGYFRAAPNFCMATEQYQAGSPGSAVPCTSKTLAPSSPIPANTRLVWLRLDWEAVGNNAAGRLDNSLAIWADSTCTVQATNDFMSVYEPTGVALGLSFDRRITRVIAPLVAPSTIYVSTHSPCATDQLCVVSWTIEGYWD